MLFRCWEVLSHLPWIGFQKDFERHLWVQRSGGRDLNPGERHSRVTRNDATVMPCALCAATVAVPSRNCCADVGRPLITEVMSHSHDGPGVTGPLGTNIVPLTVVWNPPPSVTPPLRSPRQRSGHVKKQIRYLMALWLYLSNPTFNVAFPKTALATLRHTCCFYLCGVCEQIKCKGKKNHKDKLHTKLRVKHHGVRKWECQRSKCRCREESFLGSRTLAFWFRSETLNPKKPEASVLLEMDRDVQRRRTTLYVTTGLNRCSLNLALKGHFRTWVCQRWCKPHSWADPQSCCKPQYI